MRSGKIFNTNLEHQLHLFVRPSPCRSHTDSQGGGGAGVEVVGHGSFGDGEGGVINEARQGCVILELAPF